jgi:hypothetical protein
LKESPLELFKPIIDTVNHVLFYDVFPRFIRTKECSAILAKHPNDNRLWISKKSMTYPYTNADFYQNPFISQRDFNFLKNLMFDTFDWSLVNNTKKPEYESIIYVTNTNFIPNVDIFKSPSGSKFEFVLNHTFEECCVSLTSLESLRILDPNIKFIKVTNFRSSIDLTKQGYKVPLNCSMVDVEADLLFPFPINEPRKMYYSICFQYDPKTSTLYRMVKPYLPKTFDPSSIGEKHKLEFNFEKKEEQMGRLLFVFGLTAIRKLNEYQVIFTQINCNSIFHSSSCRL